MKILYIDHDDSFGNNLVAFFRARGAGVYVRNCRDVPLDVRLLAAFTQAFDAVVLSPGPGHPQDYPASIALAQNLDPQTPYLGVCLGLQILLAAHGISIQQVSKHPKHGRVIHASQGQTSLFQDPKGETHWPEGQYTLYNSLGARASCHSLHPHFHTPMKQGDTVLVAEKKNSLHMGCQFHPESYASLAGEAFLERWLRCVHEGS